MKIKLNQNYISVEQFKAKHDIGRDKFEFQYLPLNVILVLNS